MDATLMHGTPARIAGGALLAVALHALARTQKSRLASYFRALGRHLPAYNGEEGSIKAMWFFSPEEHAETTLAMAIYFSYGLAVALWLLPAGPAPEVRPFAGLFWVAIVAIQCAYKSQKGFFNAIYITMPCHVTSLLHAVGCLTGSRACTNIGHSAGLVFTLAALANPDTRGCDLFLEAPMFWFQHYALLAWPVWDLATHDDGCGLYWSVITFFAFKMLYYLPGVWLNIKMGTNINYMMVPFPGAPKAKWYRFIVTSGFVPGTILPRALVQGVAPCVRALRELGQGLACSDTWAVGVFLACAWCALLAVLYLAKSAEEPSHSEELETDGPAKSDLLKRTRDVVPRKRAMPSPCLEESLLRSLARAAFDIAVLLASLALYTRFVATEHSALVHCAGTYIIWHALCFRKASPTPAWLTDREEREACIMKYE